MQCLFLFIIVKSAVLYGVKMELIFESVFTCIFSYTFLELIFDGTNFFGIIFVLVLFFLELFLEWN